MGYRYTTSMVEQYAINFATWILDNGFQPSDEHPHKWMKFDEVGLQPKLYTESKMLKEYKETLKKEKPCNHDYQPDCCMGIEIHACTKCGDVI